MGPQQGDHTDFVQFFVMLAAFAIQYSGFLLSSKIDQWDKRLCALNGDKRFC